MEEKKYRIGTCVFYRCKEFTSGGAHHRKQRSAGGSDNEANLVDICYRHHMWAHNHIEKAHNLGLIIFENEPEPTEKLLEIRFSSKPKPTYPQKPEIEAAMEGVLFPPNPGRQE